MSFSIALPVVRTTELSPKQVFWNIYFEIDVLRVALRRFHVTSGCQLKIFPSINVQGRLHFFFRIILSLPLPT